MASGRGVAYALWRRVEDERVAQAMSKSRLAEAAGLPRSTIDNLETSTRPPQPRIVHALADALGIPRGAAEELAGLRRAQRPGGATDSRVRAAIEASDTYDERQKEVLLNLIDVLDEANRGRPDLRVVPQTGDAGNAG